MVTPRFPITERTLQQLMTGGFRLMTKQDTDSIMRYVSIYRALQDQESTVYQEVQVALRHSQEELMAFPAFAATVSLAVTRNDPHFRLSPDVQLLMQHDAGAINRFFNQLHKYKVVTQGHVNRLKRLKSYQAMLLRYFRDKYDFE